MTDPDFQERFDAEHKALLGDPTAVEITLDQLMAKVIDPIRWTVEGLIPEGLTILAGPPKLGKSWIALQLALAVCGGHEALGKFPTHSGGILYLALEDSQRRIQDRVLQLEVEKVGVRGLRRMTIRTEWSRLADGAIDDLEAWLDDHPDTRLVIIDTWQKLRGRGSNKDMYAEEYEDIGRLHKLAIHYGLAILVIHHTRKTGSDDFVEKVSGTHGVTGAADTILVMERTRMSSTAILNITSREIEEVEWALEKFGLQWMVVGTGAEYRTTEERRSVLEAFQALGGGTQQVKDVAEELEKTTAATSKLLRKMLRENLVAEDGYGKYRPLKPVGKVVELGELTSTTLPTSTRDSRGASTHRCAVCNKESPTSHLLDYLGSLVHLDCGPKLWRDSLDADVVARHRQGTGR